MVGLILKKSYQHLYKYHKNIYKKFHAVAVSLHLIQEFCVNLHFYMS